jgi:hypothetical protein
MGHYHRLTLFWITVFTAPLGSVFQQGGVLLLPGWRLRRLAAISHQPPTLPTATSRLPHNQSHIATNGQSVSIFITAWQLRFFFVGRPLWREDGSVFCIWCWPLPAQSFSGPSPLVFATIFYCLRFDFPFRRLLRLAGSRWWYSTPPPHGFRSLAAGPSYIT